VAPFLRPTVYTAYIPPCVILAVNGDPAMCSSANLMLILYSPASVGKYDAEHVPSLLSTHVSCALEGPSIDRESPPTYNQHTAASAPASRRCQVSEVELLQWRLQMQAPCLELRALCLYLSFTHGDKIDLGTLGSVSEGRLKGFFTRKVTLMSPTGVTGGDARGRRG